MKGFILLAALLLSLSAFAEPAEKAKTRWSKSGEAVHKGAMFHIVLGSIVDAEPFFVEHIRSNHLPSLDDRTWSEFSAYLTNVYWAMYEEQKDAGIKAFCPANGKPPNAKQIYKRYHRLDDLIRPSIKAKYYYQVLSDWGPEVFGEITAWMDVLAPGTTSVSFDIEKQHEQYGIDAEVWRQDYCAKVGAPS